MENDFVFSLSQEFTMPYDRFYDGVIHYLNIVNANMVNSFDKNRNFVKEVRIVDDKVSYVMDDTALNKVLKNMILDEIEYWRISDEVKKIDFSELSEDEIINSIKNIVLVYLKKQELYTQAHVDFINNKINMFKEAIESKDKDRLLRCLVFDKLMTKPSISSHIFVSRKNINDLIENCYREASRSRYENIESVFNKYKQKIIVELDKLTIKNMKVSKVWSIIDEDRQQIALDYYKHSIIRFVDFNDFISYVKSRMDEIDFNDILRELNDDIKSYNDGLENEKIACEINYDRVLAKIRTIRNFKLENKKISDYFMGERPIVVDFACANILRMQLVNEKYSDSFDHNYELLEQFIKKYYVSFIEKEFKVDLNDKYRSLLSFYNKICPKDQILPTKAESQPTIETIKLYFDFFSAEPTNIKRHIVNRFGETSKTDATISLDDRVEFFEKLDIAKIIEGKYGYDGYIGFVLSDGIVVLENVDSDAIDKNISNATYIVESMDDFYEIVSVSKMTSRNMFKEDVINGDIAFHVDNWKNNVLEKIDTIRKKREVKTLSIKKEA